MNIERLRRRFIVIWGFLRKGPKYHATYASWRIKKWVQIALKVSFAVDERALAGTWIDTAHILGEMRATSDLTASLAGYFRRREKPKLFFLMSEVPGIVTAVDRERQQDTIAKANLITAGIFEFRRISVTFTGVVDWSHCPAGNTDWRWDLNRHAYFETLGRAYLYTSDERYARVFCSLLTDWLARNPPIVTNENWSSAFEVAFRINTWIWAFAFFRTSPSMSDDVCIALLAGLISHGRFLYFNLELHVQNNHLLLEAKSLALLGILFPEFRPARRWRRRALEIVAEQMAKQVCEDGVHEERSTHYHRVVSGEMLELLAACDANDVEVPAIIIDRFRRMIDFERWITKPDGRIPLLGDSALTDTHARFSALRGGPPLLEEGSVHGQSSAALEESSLWLLGRDKMSIAPSDDGSPETTSRSFPDGGYYVMRSGSTAAESMYLNIDCGAFGYAYDSHHGHADALSIEMFAHGRSWLVDSGVYTTHTDWPWRRFFRGSRAHNTVVVDDMDQTELLDSRRVHRPAAASLVDWITSGHIDFFDGCHDGYRRLRESIEHRRQVCFVRGEYWILIDVLTGTGEHRYDSYFHFMPDTVVELDERTGACLATGDDGASLVIIPLFDRQFEAEIQMGSTDPIQGWVSIYSGEKLPAPTLKYSTCKAAPAVQCALLWPRSAGDATVPEMSSLGISAVTPGGVTDPALVSALHVRTAEFSDYLVFNRARSRTALQFARYVTDGAFTFLRKREADGEVISTFVREGELHLDDGSAIETRNFP